MTIEERAYATIGHPKPPVGAMYVPDKLKLEEQTFVNGYIKGATEQRYIDLKQFKERLTEMQGEYITLELINDLIDDFKVE